jgi:hypothetical protein
MTTESEHLDQAAHNFAVSGHLSASQDWDWATIALFYSALHLVQAYFARSGIDARTHVQRERRMLGIADMGPLLLSYRWLRDQSENARYECRRFSEMEFESIRDGSYATISRRIRELLRLES